jgi:Leucine-rich repeat (LRR) protein
LVAIYRAAGGDKWTRRWFLSQALSQWAGVTIDDNRRVVGLTLSNNNLSGTLPEDWRYLDKLRYCLLNNNQLSGANPEGVNQLAALEVLDLSDNNFTGNIPHMGALTRLTMLDLSENNFTAAAIPAFLTGFTQLEDLRLKHTNRTGALPAGLQALTKLHTLDLSYNSFTGAIPDWAALTNLRVLYIYHASLSGNIPAFIAGLPALEWLALDNNNLTGAIPDGSYAALEKLWLNNNNLTGAIPAAIKTNPRWNTFHVCSGNNLTNCSGDNPNPAAPYKANAKRYEFFPLR